MPGVLGLVSFRVFPTHMGGQKGVALFYKHLQEQLDVVLALSTDNKNSGSIPAERVLYPNKQMYRNFFRTRQLRDLVREKNISIIVAEHSYTGWLAWLTAKQARKPFIIHSHNIESRRFQEMGKWWWPVYRWYEGWIHRKAQHSFFISQEDLDHAVKQFDLPEAGCSVVTYGVEEINRFKKREQLRRELGLDINKKLFLFNGTLDYEPNMEAVETLIQKVEPLLRKKLSNFSIIITGNRARKELIEKMIPCENIIYMGYVDSVDDFYQACDLFLNPVDNNSGVKTKLVEAIANHCTAISTHSGASGIRKDLCGNKLVLAKDNDWSDFVDKVIESSAAPESDTPEEFYAYYSWTNIARNAASKIREVIAVYD